MKDNIEIRSDEVREVMEKIPGWIIRWGTTLIFSVLLIILIGTYFFKYPTIIYSRIVVTTENPPASVVARSSGRISHIFVHDTQKVVTDQNIAIIENPANYKHVLNLRDKLQFISDFLDYYDPDLANIFESNLSLGEIQSYYTIFMTSLEDYNNFIELDFHTKKISSLKAEQRFRQEYYVKLIKQAKISSEKVELVKRQYLRDSAMHAQGVISGAEIDRSNDNYLKELYDLEQVNLKLASSEIDIADLKKQILELELEKVEKSKQQKLALLEAYENLLAEVSKWELKYLLKAPTEGIVTFTRVWSSNQIVHEGEIAFTVIPENSGTIIGKINLPIKGSGKVKVNQTVNIKFDNYPYMEYGMVKGIIKNISLVPEDNDYFVEVNLPEGLKTFYNKELEFNQQMQGVAEIITDDLSLLRRILNPVKFVIEKNIRK